MGVNVNLRHLEEGPQQLQGEVSAKDLELDTLGDEIIRVNEPLRYDVEVEQQDRNLLIGGSLEANLDCQCVRCLKPFKMPLVMKPYHLYVALEGEEAAPVANDMVDLTPFFREDVLLAFPQHPLCSEDCAGLPNALGANSAKPGKSPQGNEIESSSAWNVLDQLKLK
jgi:uncharacterized protein